MSANYINLPWACFLSNMQTYYNKANSVPSSIETDIVTLTIGAGQTFIFLGGSASAKTDTDFTVYIDGNVKEVKRLAWTDRDIDFKFNDTVNSGEIVKITGIHTSLIAHDFEATIFGVYV